MRGMSIWGKIIGGVAGFAAGGPLGALLGAVAGHAVDKMRTDSVAELPPPESLGRDAGLAGGLGQAAKQMAFSVAVIVLGAKMAKVDGVVSRAEINAFKEVFRVPPQDMKGVARIFDAARRDAAGFEPYARQVAMLFRREPAVLEGLLAGLVHIARADGELTPAEQDYLGRVADIFGLDATAFERARASFGGGGAVGDPYQVLGVAPGESDEAVKSAYRRLIRENHPDALIAKGMPREFIEVANDKMAAINAAYDQIAKARGLK